MTATPGHDESVRRIADAQGGLAAVVDREVHGYLVLTAGRVMFVDVDLGKRRDDRGAGRLARLVRLARRRGRGAGGRADEDAALRRLRRWLAQDPARGARVYRTRRGLRYLVTHATFDPRAEESDAILDALGSDPEYRDRCRSLGNYRARLTPKPWRVGVDAPPADRWPERYAAACAGWATCAFVGAWGDDRVHPEVAAILPCHDETSRATSGLPLA